MQRIKQNTSYYINERAVNLVENALGDPSLIQVSLYSGTVVLVYIKGIIDYAYDGGYQRFPLYGYNTALVSNEAHHIYIRIDRSRGTAMLLFSTQEYEFDSDESGQYWYIRCGEVTDAGSGSTPREITFDSGLLSTAEGLESMIDGRYVSVRYFERIFDVLKGNTPVKTNDLSATFDSLKVKTGLWTEQFVSALGKNTNGSGGSGGGEGGGGEGDGGATSLAQLSDVSIINPSNGQILKYNEATGKWEASSNLFFIIADGDSTTPTNNNVFSALASEKRYLRKDVVDTASQKIIFNKGLQIGQNFVSGIAGGIGGKIDQDANAELRSLVLRSFLQVPELRYNRVLVELGDKWNPPGAGIIEEVTINDDGVSGTCKLKLEDGEIGAIYQDAICMGIFHSETAPEMNATVNSDDSKGNFEYAGFYTCYFRITSVSNAEGKVNNQYFTYVLRPTDGSGGSWNKAWHPSVGMHFVCYGIFTDFTEHPELKAYGCSQYQTKTYTRLLFNQNTWEIGPSNIAMQTGDLSNMSIHGIEMEGYSAYLNNVYFTGTIRQVDSAGNTIQTANDRGSLDMVGWSGGTEPDRYKSFAYWDRISMEDGLWLCINENGATILEDPDNPGHYLESSLPKNNPSDWLHQVPAGESLQPYGHWSSKNTPYHANSVVSFADRVWVSNKETSEPPYPAYLLSDGSYALLSDNGYALAGETESDDWDLLIDISGITDGEDGEGLEVQYSADKTNWHTTPLETDLYFRQRVGSSGAWSPAYLMVGESGQDGDYKDFEFAVNQSTTTAPSSGWQDAPPTVPNGYYLWMRVRWVYGDGRQPSAWAVTRIKGDKGDKGDSNVLVDFTNEIIQVACDSTYKAAGAQTKTTGVNMYYGTNSCAISTITVSGTHSEWVEVSTPNATITFAIPDQAIVSEITYDVAVTGTYNGQTYTRTVKLVLHGVRGGADGSPAVLYELEPSVDTIAKYKDDTLSVANISCTRIKYVGDQRSITTDGGLRYRIDDTGDEVSISNEQNIPTSRINKSITFYLYINDTLVDKERIPLITDGKDGAGFALAGAWSSEHGTYSKMSVVSMGGASFVAMNDTANPPMWCYKLSDGSYAKLSDGGYVLTGEENTTDWEKLSSAPIAPLDSISDEFIFKNAINKPAKPTSQDRDDYVPSGWTDDPVGVSISFPTEWVCKRTRRNGVWGEYSDPAVFAQFGKDGNFKSRVFKRTNNAPATPTGGSYNNPIPNGWEDGIPSGTAILWSSVCTFSADGTSSGWSTPSPETDTDTLDIEFSPSQTEPAAPSGSTPYADHESEGWYDPNSPNFGGKDYIWRAERKVSNGVYDGAWTITRIKGEKGDSNVIADLDNEVQSIACDASGKATAAYTLTTNVSMWYGTTELTLSSITNTTATNVTITPNVAQKKVTFAIAKNAVIAEVNNITLTLQAVHNSVTYTRTLVFTLNGVRGGADGTPATIYELVPSVSSVKKDKNGNLSVNSISCTRQKTVGSTITNNTTDGAFTYSVNGGNEQSYTNNQSITIQATTTRVQFYLRINSVLVDTETIHVLADGADGESVIFADIDNEVQSIACTSAGKATKAYTLTTTVSMWHGLTELTLSNVTWNTISGITVSRSGKILTFTIANNATIAEVNKFNLAVSAVYGGQTYSKSLVFTINGVRGGADGTPATIYDLVPSASSVKRDKNGTHTPSTVSCTRQKTVGTTITNNTTDGTLTYSVNGGSEQSYTNNTNITITSAMKTIAFFFKISGTLVDKETISVIEDGADGRSVAISNQSVTYQVGNSGTTAPTGTWQSTVPTVAQGKYLWTKTVVTYDDGTSTTAYSVSRAASDGANGTSVTITNTSVTYAVTSNGTQPADSAFTYNSFPSVEVGKFYWVKTVVTYSDSTSTKSYSVGRVGSDGEDGLPGAPGEDGKTSYLHMAYANSADGSQGFSRTYFAGALYIGTYTDFTQTDSTSYSAYEWKRLKGEDGAGFNHRGDWASGMTLSTNDVVNMGGGTYVARHDNVTVPPLSSYLLSNGDRIKLSDGGYALNGQLNVTDYWVMVARPDDGADGTDFEFIFRLTATENSKPSKPSSPQTDDYIPSGWTDDATGISKTYRAEWFCMRKKENGIWGEYSDVALWSRYAEDGEDGEDAIFADLDNEMDSVSIDDTGKTMAATVFNSNIWFAFGTEKVTPTSVSFSGQPSGVTCSHNNGLVTINVPSGTQMPVANDYKADITITLSATIGGNSITRNLVFTIKGVVGGVVYQLVPQYSLIRKSVSGSTVTLTPQTLNIQVRKIANGVPSLAGRNDVSVYATIDSGSRNEVIRGSSSEYWQLSLPTTMSKVFLEAVRKSDNVVFDSETIQVVEDGADGAPGSPGSAGRGITGVVRQFRLSDSSTSLVGNYQWSTTVPERRTGTYIWARDVTNYDSGNPTYGTAFCASGDTGFNGCTVRTHQNGFEVGKTYVNQTNVASVDLRYMDVVITPTKHSAASGYDVYMCKATSTVYAAGDEDDTSKWEEVSQNEASAYFTYLIAKEANINVLSGASFTIQDANGDTSIIIDSGGITQVYTAADGVDASVVGQPKMVFGGGMITYYNTDGSKAWQIGSAAQFQTSTIDSWVQKKLMFMGQNRNTAIIKIKSMDGTKVDAMQFSPGSNSSYNDYRGYTVLSGNTSQVPSSVNPIANGYYTQYSSVPAQSIVEDDKVRYAVRMMRYTGGYIVSTETVEWEE